MTTASSAATSGDVARVRARWSRSRSSAATPAATSPFICCFFVQRRTRFDRLQGEGPIHGAAFQVHIAELARQRGGNGALAGTGWPVDGNDQFPGEGLVAGRMRHCEARLYTRGRRVIAWTE